MFRNWTSLVGQAASTYRCDGKKFCTGSPAPTLVGVFQQPVKVQGGALEPWRVAPTISSGRPRTLIRPGFVEKGEADVIQIGWLSLGLLGQQRVPAVYVLDIGFRRLEEIFHGV